ncbi:MAG: phosphatase PAP2 family protein [Bryobacteraceae bacterium]
MIMPLLFSAAYGGLWTGLGNNPILALAVAGAFIIHLASRPSRREVLITLVLAAVLRLLYERITGGSGRYFGSMVIIWGSFLGISSLLVLAVHAIRERGEERKSALSDLIAGGAFFYYWIVLGFALTLTDYLIPRVYDEFFYAFDGSLGFQPSFVLGRLIYGRPLAWGLVRTLYFAIALPVAMLYASQRRRSYVLGYKIFPLLIAASTGGYLLYYVLPGTGPIYEFRGLFPFHIPPVAPHLGKLEPMMERAVRNGMPSLHFGTALLLWWNCRIWPMAARRVMLLFLLGTAFATLALGQHYLIDLVVAFPVMLIFQAAAITAVPLSARERWLPLAVGCCGTFAWLAFLRYGAALWLGRHALSWILVSGTMIGCCWLESRLWKKARMSSEPRQPVIIGT